MEPTVEITVNPEHVREIHALESKEYKDFELPCEQLVQWSQRYKRGFLALMAEGKPVGAIGLWPVTQDCFEQVIAGKKDEEHIHAVKNEGDAHEVDVCESATPYWYVGDIIMGRQWRMIPKGLYDLHFIAEALKILLAAPGLPKKLIFFAFPFTPEGKACLYEYGFEELTKETAERLRSSNVDVQLGANDTPDSRLTEVDGEDKSIFVRTPSGHRIFVLETSVDGIKVEMLRVRDRRESAITRFSNGRKR